MRISDWSSDVCSSDLRLRSAAMSTTYTIDTSTSRATPVSAPMKRMTVHAIRKRKGTDQPLVMLTAYTAPMAHLFDPHCDMLLSSEELRVGKECVSTCRSWGWAYL